MMILRKFYIRQDQDQALAELPGNKAEHVRAALDVYLPEKKREVLNVSTSSSRIALTTSSKEFIKGWNKLRNEVLKKGDEEDGRSFNVPSAEEE